MSIRTFLTILIVACALIAWLVGLLPAGQLGIAACGVTAVNLSQDTDPDVQRWGCIFGLLGQPFWFYETAHAQQWGIFILCFLYTLSWMRGLWNFWLEPWLDKVMDRAIGERPHPDDA